MIKFKDILKESNIDYDIAEDFSERRSRELESLAVGLKQSGGHGRVRWRTIPARLLAKVWLQFGKYNKIDANDLDKIADQMLTNIARLRASTEMMGHTQYSCREELVDLGYEFTDEEWKEWMPEYLTGMDNSWLISDYGLPKLEKLYDKIFKSDTPEERLYAIDKALNIIHQRSDLSAMFIEGGKSTLMKIANQGGYVSPD